MRKPESQGVVLRGLEIMRNARRIGGSRPVSAEAPPAEQGHLAPGAQSATEPAPGIVASRPSAEALAAAEAAVRAAEQRGYESGLAKGTEAARRDFAERFSRFDELLKGISRRQDDLLEVLEDDLVELVFEAASSLLGDPQLRRDLVVQAVRGLLAGRPDTRILTVRLAPTDLELVAASTAAQDLGIGSRIKLQADPKLQLGGCIIETTRGSLDARLESRLDKLRHALLAGRAAEASES